ncbi:MAG: S9 family peptidase [Pseudobdellovibrionaceae bacterium]
MISVIFAVSFLGSPLPVQASYQGFGKESLTLEQIKKFEAPEVPDGLATQIQRYFDVRSPGAGILAAKTKKQLFFNWGVTGTSQIWRIDQPKGFPVQLTGGKDSTMLVGQTPDGKWLIVSRDRNGEEHPGLYLLAPTGGALMEIQHLPKVRTFLQGISSDSRFLYFTANDLSQESYAIYRFEIKTKKKELLLKEPGIWSVADHRDDGWWLLNKTTGSFSDEIYLFNTETKEMKPLLGQNEKEEYTVMFTDRPDQYLVLSHRGGDFRTLFLWQGKSWKALSPKKSWDVESLQVDRARTKVIFTMNENGFTRLYGFEMGNWKKIVFPAFPGADHVSPGSLTRDGSHLMLSIETSQAPRLSYSYNFKNRLLTQWVLPSSPEVETSKFVASREVQYEARDGSKIPMLLRASEACEKRELTSPCPVVIHFHGGPEAQSEPGFSVVAQLFVENGFIFAEPNVRGSTGYGRKYRDLDNGPLRENVITDIEDAALYFRKKTPVTRKVGSMGWSYGGYSTLMALTRFSESFDAGVALVGMSNLVTFLENTAPFRRPLRVTEYGDPVKDRESLLRLSPVTWLEKANKPLLIIQGANDPRVPAGEAVQMHQALAKKGIKSQLILFADEGHGSAKRENRVLEIGNMLQFFLQNL